MAGRSPDNKSSLYAEGKTLKLTIFFSSIVLAVIAYYFLFAAAFSDADTQASGEIFINEGEASSYQEQSGFLGFLFDYFGGVCFLFPLVIVHVGYLLPKLKLSLRKLNFFKAGLYILGFDCAVLGLTTVYSAVYSRGRTGGGGILGDFFYLQGNLFPQGVSALIALLLALTGIFFMVGRNPLAVMEDLGSLAVSLLGRLMKGRSAAAAAAGGRSAEAKLKDTADSSKEDAEQGSAKRQNLGHFFHPGYKNEPRDKSSLFERQEPSFGPQPKPQPSQTAAPQPSEQAAPGVSKRSAEEQCADAEQQAIENEALDFAQSALEQDRRVTTIYDRRPSNAQERREPTFGTEPSSNDDLDRQLAEHYASSPYSSSPYQKETFKEAIAREQASEGGHSTIITRQAPRSENSVLLNVSPHPEPSAAVSDDGPHYISPHGAEPMTREPPLAESESDRLSTIITKSGSAVPGAEAYAEQTASEVSTLITHEGPGGRLSYADTQNAAPGPATAIFGPGYAAHEENPQEPEIHSYITRTPRQEDYNPEYAEPSEQSRIISFNDYQPEAKPSFEINPGDFDAVPKVSARGDELTGQDADPSYASESFLKPREDLISEKDLPDDYKSATRGVFGEKPQEQPLNHTQQPVSAQNFAPSAEPQQGNVAPQSAVFAEGADNHGAEPPAEEPFSPEEADRRIREGLSNMAREVEEAQRLVQNVRSVGQSGAGQGSSAVPQRLSFLERKNLEARLQRGEASESAPAASKEALLNKEQALPYNQQPVLPAALTAARPAVNPAAASSEVQIAAEPGTIVSRGISSVSQSMGGSLDNSGFMGRPQNSSGTNFPGYITPEEQVSTISPKIAPLATVSCPSKVYGDWLPSIELIDSGRDQKTDADEEEKKKNDLVLYELADKLDRCLIEFNVRAQVQDFQEGPVVVCYLIHLEPGVKSSTITSLASDLCRKMMVHSLRIIESLPGTDCMGVEVPNPFHRIIYLGEILRSQTYQQSTAALPICLGLSTRGEPIIVDLAKAPHLLICGATGSGKSVTLQAIIISLLMRFNPQQLRLIMIDTKRVELSFYQDLPHLLTPVVQEEETAAAALRWCVEEMERRYMLLSAFKLRNLEQFNAKAAEQELLGEPLVDPSWNPAMGYPVPTLKPLPSIVICIEEYADLMSQTRGRKNDQSPEALLSRLAAKARACGIYLILATQTPRADVVTGPIKANIPARIALLVQSNIDSRVILDESGAEKLLGNGDMIFKFPSVNGGRSTRAHSGYISNDNIAAVVKAWHDYAGDPEFVAAVIENQAEEGESESDEGGDSNLDKLFDKAAAFARSFIESKKKNPAISDFQVTLGVGYPRAKRIVQQLKEEGVLMP